MSEVEATCGFAVVGFARELGSISFRPGGTRLC
jgi:hypothetical protein